MSISRLFPRTVCINLDCRPDRWRRVCERFTRSRIGPVERFAAVDGKRVEVPAEWEGRAGVYGCQRSHLQVVAAARADRLESLLVFEDDVEFAEDVGPKFSRAFAQVPHDWNILYLGGIHRVPPMPVGDAVARVSRTLSTFAYAIHSRAFEPFLEFGHARDVGIDLQLIQLQARHPCYCVFPHVAWVEVDHSDVQGFEDNHWYIRESLVIGDRCADDMAGAVALVVPARSPAWRRAGPSQVDFLIGHLGPVLPGLRAIVDDGPWPQDAGSIAARVSAALDERIDYILVAGSPVFLAQRHVLAALEMCRSFDVVIPFRESATLTPWGVGEVLSGRGSKVDPARYPRSPLGGRELGWGLFARAGLMSRRPGSRPSVFEVPLVGLRLDAPALQPGAIASPAAEREVLL
jgi:hypothetical protein